MEFESLWTKLEELKTDTTQLGDIKNMILKQNEQSSKDFD